MGTEHGTKHEQRGRQMMAFLAPAVALFALAVAFVAALGRGAAAGDRMRREAYRRWLEERGSRETDSPPFTGPPNDTAARSSLSR